MCSHKITENVKFNQVKECFSVKELVKQPLKSGLAVSPLFVRKKKKKHLLQSQILTIQLLSKLMNANKFSLSEVIGDITYCYLCAMASKRTIVW